MNMPPMIRLLRPKQWVKTAFVVAPIFFAQQFTDMLAWQQIISVSLAFLCAAIAVYILNDIYDRHEDRRHPTKSLRPIASSEVSVAVALGVALIIALASGFLLASLPVACVQVVVFYVASNILYTLLLKKQALLDVFFIAICFVLRVLAGCYALSVTVSPWIILTTFMLALFLGFGKRYHELGVEGYVDYKQNLQHYSRDLLDKLIVISSSASLVSYALYTVEMTRQGKGDHLVYTVIFVAFGLFRYLQSIYVYKRQGLRRL